VSAQQALGELLRLRPPPPLKSGEVSIRGSDPFYRAPYRAGECGAACLAATGVAANDIWEIRTGSRQQMEIGVPEAAATLRAGEYTQHRDDTGVYRRIPPSDAMVHMRSITQPWPTRDGRWFLPHFNLPNLRARVLGVLQCADTPADVSAAVRRWNADELEEAVAAARGCGGMIRSTAEWLAHPQGAWLATRPVVEIERMDDSAAEPFHPGPRPLSGVRVLDLTRILAGPIAGRTLAEHGADVLMITAGHLPQVTEYVRETSHGKRSCFLDLKHPDGSRQFAELARTADIVIDGYRSGRVEALGFGPAQLAALRPGLIHVSVSCFGSGGPFAGRAGWEQIAQSVTGACHTHGQLTGAGQPKLVPVTMCDFTTGYLGAYGAMLALAQRARQGGSWAVRVSLCQSAMFIRRQGLLQEFSDAPEHLAESVLANYYVAADTAYGALKSLGPVLHMSETAPYWASTTVRLGSSSAGWLPRN
jgi:crotonobetainyl-CoA:carnitine CoA-transferase CaiB-like acyl-CoA transferase